MHSNLSEFLAYYEKAHRNAANRHVHHLAHAVAAIGILLLWRPLFGIGLIAIGFVVSWAGHYFLERNTPAFFAAPEQKGPAAGVVKKAQVALGGIVWSGACFLRLFNHGPLARVDRQLGVAQQGAPTEVSAAASRRQGRG
jgi:hypothetical protein